MGAALALRSTEVMIVSKTRLSGLLGKIRSTRMGVKKGTSCYKLRTRSKDKWWLINRRSVL